MPSKITFFPVGNGDMVLIKLEDKTTILIDINIRDACADEKDSACDVLKELRKRIEKDSKGRPYVDVFCLSHPDQDHCKGLRNYFHLGHLDEYNYEPPEGEERKIVIREIWSSPLVFRRASKTHTLGEDANAFNKEARRRVKVFRENRKASDGDRILIIGEDENGKTDDILEIVVKVDETFSKVNGKENNNISMYVVAPLPIDPDEKVEEELGKNHSSIIIRYSLKAGDKSDACLYLTGGDAEVYIWEKLWKKHKKSPEPLKYDLLLSPHHCSWHVLSYDSWSECDDPKVNQDAKSALSQTRDGAFIVSSSNPIKDDDKDPPCWGAKKEYESIVKKVSGEFFCTGEYPNEDAPEPLEFSITKEGPQPPSKRSVAIESGSVLAASTREPVPHG